VAGRSVLADATGWHPRDAARPQGVQVRRLALFVVHRRWVVIILAAIFLPLAAAIGGGVAQKLTVGGLEDPASESARTAAEIQKRFANAGQSDFVVLVTARDGNVDAPAVKAAGLALTKKLAGEPGIVSASSYWSVGNLAPLKSDDGKQALIFGSVNGELDKKVKVAKELSEPFTTKTAVMTTAVTGRAEIARQVSKQAEEDLRRSETLTAPIIFLALIAVFGGVVAALLPLSVGVLAVVGTLVILTILVSLTEVSVFSLNLTTGLGFGLAIDYSLFIVSRYREELAAGASTNVAVGRTMQTAGRTVAFSAGTVMISLLALLLFPVTYLRSFAYAGVAVVFLAAIASVIVLPAILAVLGARVEALRVFNVKPPGEDGFWGHQAARVMRHPIPYAVGVSAVLVVLAIPFLNFNPGLIDDRVVPDSVSSRAATDQVRKNFASREADALQVLAPTASLETDAHALDVLARKIAVLPGVSRVDAGNGFYLPATNGSVAVVPPPSGLGDRFHPDHGTKGTWISVVPSIEPHSAAGERLVKDIRGLHAPFAFTVAGTSAVLVDTKKSVLEVLPWTLGLIGLATFVLLFLMTGSLLVPVKALLLNVLSLTATFGAMVWIFQEGHFSDFLGFTPTGTIDVFTPILMFCIAFGLSMDYEVFLLSRIKEEYDLDRDNEHAVRVGLQKTGRIVTAAALLLTIVFVGIATSKVSIVQLFGVGLSLAVLVDAFLIRATLVPAFMRLAGRANWWSPRPLRRWHLRYGIWENEPIAILDREFEATT
jgi:RND superfamily putative drug exporter